jgi:hypothetical protein
MLLLSNTWRIEIGKPTQDRATGERQMSSWIERLYQARADLSERRSDPWRGVLERALPGNIMSISTNALLDLLDVPHTTGNARRLAQTMRALGWIGLKSRRLTPGGFRDTTIRGWSRPIREKRLEPRTACATEGDENE